MRPNSNDIGGSFRNDRDRWFLLLTILGIQIFVGAYLWQTTQTPRALMGFLSERKGHFILAWKEELSDLQVREYATLSGALSFASEQLSLKAGHTPRADLTPESVWINERFGNPVVFWKTDASPRLFQMTFQAKKDADFFAKAFREGSYTPSPIGHAILLTPSDVDVLGLSKVPRVND